MHLLRHPRNALAVGVLFYVIGFFYWALPYFGNGKVDYTGVTLFIALGTAMSLMAYVLAAGSPRS
jgi:hypothetical protein